MEDHPAVNKAQVAGSVRRAKETVKDIDLVVSSDKPAEVMEHFTTAPDVIEVTGRGNAISSARFEPGVMIDLRVVTETEFPYVLNHFTGSKAHTTALQARAKSIGMELKEHGLFKNDELVPCDDEEQIYSALRLPLIPPERRENMGEIEQAGKGGLAPLVTADDIVGLFHCHTEYSDGVETVETMAKACMQLGYKYLGISDHSRTAAYAGGLTIDDLKRQSDHIDELNERLDGFHIFKGVESDILNDGSLDYPDEVLQMLDFVIASVHLGFLSGNEQMTDRIVKAIEKPVHNNAGPPHRQAIAGQGSVSCEHERCNRCMRQA